MLNLKNFLEKFDKSFTELLQQWYIKQTFPNIASLDKDYIYWIKTRNELKPRDRLRIFYKNGKRTASVSQD